MFKEVHHIHKIESKRREKGWTQQKLSQVSGVSQPTISQIENGKRHYPSHDSIRRLAKALGVEVEELDEENESLISL
ncbi:helix-turn-helix domain-containing protein [Paenibacillus shenyangensis]|uniref:helix-turn-helix domain-containing protein n=1 Tax=Paenibacillus sp. A9 TaxID=1284352 RepID=UPI003082FB51